MYVGNDGSSPSACEFCSWVTDSGTYECAKPISGRYVYLQVQNPVNYYSYINLNEIRVYGLKSLTKTASLLFASAPSSSVYDAKNLMSPLAPRSHRRDWKAVENANQGMSTEENCYHTTEAAIHGEALILTFELKTHSSVGAMVLVSDIGQDTSQQYLTFSDFRVFVGGNSSDYKLNQECTGGPFLKYADL